MMTYEEAREFLDKPAYAEIRPGLDTIKQLMRLLGNPQDKLRYVHVAGTNGKGSTAAFIESILRHSGYKTGLYTSPYIQHFEERIRVGDQTISKADLARLTNQVYQAVQVMDQQGQQLPTAFELVTAIGFLYFEEQQCDLVVLETGLGGRLDATNCIQSPEVAVITAIAYDHMKLLGSTLAAIAGEKAGIIKKGSTVVSYIQQPEAAAVIDGKCHEIGAALKIAPLGQVERIFSDIHGQQFRVPGYPKLQIGLLGPYQINNAVVAMTAAEILMQKGYAITPETIYQGLHATKWPGRLEVIGQKPLFLIDGAHNPNGVQALYNSLENLFPKRKITFIMGVLADKNYREMVHMVTPLAQRFLTVTPPNPRALDGKILAQLLQNSGMEATSFTSIEAAVDEAQKRYQQDVVCAFGSLYYIGLVRQYCVAYPLQNI